MTSTLSDFLYTSALLFLVSPLCMSEFCQTGWIRNNQTSFCYKLFETPPLNWEKAKVFCEQQNAWLSDLENVKEQIFITETLLKNASGGGVWLGASDAEQPNRWRWVDNSIMDITKYNWIPGNPDNNKEIFNIHAEDCLNIEFGEDTRGLLNDVNCNLLKAFLCKTRAYVVSTLQTTSIVTSKDKGNSVAVPVITSTLALLVLGIAVALTVIFLRSRRKKRRTDHIYEENTSRSPENDYSSLDTANSGACASDNFAYEQNMYEGSIHLYHSACFSDDEKKTNKDKIETSMNTKGYIQPIYGTGKA